MCVWERERDAWVTERWRKSRERKCSWTNKLRVLDSLKITWRPALILWRTATNESALETLMLICYLKQPAMEQVRCAAWITMVIYPGKKWTTVVTLKILSKIWSYLANPKSCFVVLGSGPEKSWFCLSTACGFECRSSTGWISGSVWWTNPRYALEFQVGGRASRNAVTQLYPNSYGR